MRMMGMLSAVIIFMMMDTEKGQTAMPSTCSWYILSDAMRA